MLSQKKIHWAKDQILTSPIHDTYVSQDKNPAIDLLHQQVGLEWNKIKGYRILHIRQNKENSKDHVACIQQNGGYLHISP